MSDHGFTIDGEVCPLVTLSEFTMGERQVLFENSGIIVEDFRRGNGETDEERDARIENATRNPGYLLSLLHVAYQRRHPEMTRQQVAGVVENVNAELALRTLGEDDQEENPPTGSESTTSPEPTSETSQNGSPTSSGDGSSTSSGQPGNDPSPITGSKSHESQPSDLVTSQT